MLLSIHIPKTAGTSFHHYLRKVFTNRLMTDYGDWVEIKTEEGIRHNERRQAEILSRTEHIRQHFDAIHGHYLAGKYIAVFANAQVVAFIRDPYQHAISTYEHASRSDLKNDAHPGIRLFRENRMTAVDFIEAFPNHQSLYLSDMPLDDFAMIGLTESYDRSLALFRAIFGVAALPDPGRKNVNPSRKGAVYEITDDVRRAVDKHRAEDLALYRRARERFEVLARRHDL
jgi:hypothetical protein